MRERMCWRSWLTVMGGSFSVFLENTVDCDFILPAFLGAFGD